MIGNLWPVTARTWVYVGLKEKATIGHVSGGTSPLAVFDRATGEVFSDHFSLHIVELLKFALEADEVVTPLESWCYYFEHGASLDLEELPVTLDRPLMRKAMEVLMRMSQDAQERDRYESRLEYRRDMQQFQADAANALEKGMEKGMEKGTPPPLHAC